jgi:hypothetical protein
MNFDNFKSFEKDGINCSSTDLEWYGKLPSYKYCGFYGRQNCYSDANGLGGQWCKDHCASDLLQAFGDVDGHGSSTSAIRVSAYFTWYSKTYNQPVMSGFWSSAFDADAAVARPCDTTPSMCDATCADSGPLNDAAGAGAAAAGAFAGCGGARACDKFASCALGSTAVSQYWADQGPPGSEPGGPLHNAEACKAAGYLWEPAYPPKYPDPQCTWQTMGTDCKTGRCFDRGHIVPSGSMGTLFGRSGLSFTMCNIAAQVRSRPR